MGAALHWDHFWGRARAESVESTWMLCPHCDLEKTDNKPSRIEWLNEFWDHCEWFAYVDEQEKVNRAITLQKAKHPAPPPERTTT
jgi:hypothetical protein